MLTGKFSKTIEYETDLLVLRSAIHVCLPELVPKYPEVADVAWNLLAKIEDLLIKD